MSGSNLNGHQPPLVTAVGGRLRVPVQASSDIHKIGDWARSENLAYRVSPTDNGLWTVDVDVSAVTDGVRLACLILRLSDLAAQTAGRAAARRRLGEHTHD